MNLKEANQLNKLYKTTSNALYKSQRMIYLLQGNLMSQE